MSTTRYQRNVTISPEQEAFVKANYGKMNNKELARKIGVKYGKTLKNLRVMGLHIPTPYEGIVVKMEGYFDIDKFAKYYNY